MQQNVHRRCFLLMGQFVQTVAVRTSARVVLVSPGLSSVILSESPAYVNNGRSLWSHAQQFRAIAPLSSERLLHTGNTGNWCKKEVDTVKTQVRDGDKAKTEDTSQHTRSIAPTNFDKKILVWTGKYPTINEVPPLVSDVTLNSAKNKFRVYVNICMAFATFCTALVVMYFGRRRAERGESVARMNMVRHPNQYQQHLEPQSEGNK